MLPHRRFNPQNKAETQTDLRHVGLDRCQVLDCCLRLGGVSLGRFCSSRLKATVRSCDSPTVLLLFPGGDELQTFSQAPEKKICRNSLLHFMSLLNKNVAPDQSCSVHVTITTVQLWLLWLQRREGRRREGGRRREEEVKLNTFAASCRNQR